MQKTFLILLFMILSRLLTAQSCLPVSGAVNYTVSSSMQFGPGSLSDIIFQINMSGKPANIYFNVPGNSIQFTTALPKIIPQVSISGSNTIIDGQGVLSMPVFTFAHSASCYSGITFKNTAPSNLSVINTNDSGPGSLRDAINTINASPSGGNISFNIPGNAPHVIQPLSDLPFIERSVTIDGSTQPAGNYTGKELKVVLDGTKTGNNSSIGILLLARGSRVYGLQIQNFGNGIYIAGVEGSNSMQNIGIGSMDTGKEVVLIKNYQGIGANDVSVFKITNCYIGTNISGDSALGNTVDGMIIRNIKFGDITNNVISGNYRGITGTNLNGSNIINNKIGTDITGKKNLGNRGYGIANYEGYAYIEGNLISGNGSEASGGGIYNDGEATIRSNKIGTDITGTYAIPNYRGIEIDGGAQVGGYSSKDGNLISGNADAGIYSRSRDTILILNNTIGLNANGTDSLGNKGIGIYCDCNFFNIGYNQVSGNGNAGILIMAPDTIRQGIISNNIIGLNKALNKSIGNRNGIFINTYNPRYKAPVQITENVISGNKKHGIFSAAADVVIKNNYIGTTSSLLPGLGNGENGIDLLGASSVIIGANGPNTIAYNKSYGVNMETSGTDSCRFNLISKNKMFGNGQKGINIRVLPTQWAQDKIPAPAITGVKAAQLTGTTLPGAMVEIFVKDTGNALQGKKFIGETKADQAGKWVMNGNFTSPCEMVAVAIDQFNNTSEFAAYTLSLSINKGADTSFLCNLKPNVLAVEAPFASLTWSTGAHAESIVPNNPGKYFVTGIDSCSNVSSDTISVISGPAVNANFSFETIAQQVIFTNQSVGAKNYVWKFGNGNSSSSINPQYTFPAPDKYLVTLIADNGCYLDSVAKTVSVIITGTESITDNSIAVYPTVLAEGDGLTIIAPSEGLAFDIISTDGKSVLQNINVRKGKNELFLKGISAGNYILKMYNDQEVVNNFRIILH